MAEIEGINHRFAKRDEAARKIYQRWYDQGGTPLCKDKLMELILASEDDTIMSSLVETHHRLARVEQKLDTLLKHGVSVVSPVSVSGISSTEEIPETDTGLTTDTALRL